MQAAKELSKRVGVSRACRIMGVSRVTEFRTRRPSTAVADRKPAAVHPRALTEAEECAVLGALGSERYVDCAPAAVFASMLEDGIYLCSESTMYRMLRKHRATQERRAVRRHVAYEAPQLMATAPNQVWSWDVTKLLGHRKFEYYYLYVMLDIFSRRVVGWMVAEREGGTLASEFIRDCCAREGTAPGSSTIHSGRGAPMMSKPVVALLSSLGVHKTASRPHVSNDNPFIESLFKTMKYRPCFPKRFGSVQDVRAILLPFFDWYNSEHRHSGIAFYTPNDVHFGRLAALSTRRDSVLTAAYAATPQRFVRGVPRPSAMPQAAWINPPRPSDAIAAMPCDGSKKSSLKGATQHVNVA